MPITKVTGEVSTTNYYSPFTGDNSNILLLKAKANLNSNLNVSLGVGNMFTLEDGKSKDVPAIEAKASYDIGKYLNNSHSYLVEYSVF